MGDTKVMWKKIMAAVFLVSLCLWGNAWDGICKQRDVDSTKKSKEDTAMETQAADNIGKTFPEVTGESLAGNQVTIPDSAKGKVTLVVVAFLRENQGQLDSWLNPFVEKFGDNKGYMFYEVPMISTGYKFMKFIIDGGMRGGIPAFKHKHVVTMYGNVEKYISALNLDPRNGYAFLLDKEGKIRWQGQGYASKDDLNTLMREAENLAE